jgi:hypothetical protein
MNGLPHRKSSDIWVIGSRDYRAFETYLLPGAPTDTGIDGETVPDRYVAARAAALHERLTFVAGRAERGELAAILADGTNLGLSRMADASRAISYHHLVNVAQWHISDDNYVAARAAIINAHPQSSDGSALG